jgi:glycine C-acetyltransferase
VAASCLAALDILEQEPEWIARLWTNARFFKEGLARMGFDTGSSESPITPVITGDDVRAQQLSDQLFDAGVFAQAITYPTVPEGRARVRTIVTATHTREDLALALDGFALAGARLGLI